MKRKFLAFLLTLAMVLPLVPTSIFAAEVVASGKCGENVTWTLDNKGLLIISGNGPMTYYDYRQENNGIPWYDYRSQIKTIIIKDGVTSIGNSAFLDCDKLENVDISNTVTSIGPYGFVRCKSLKNIIIPQGVSNLHEETFVGCSSLECITIPKSINYINWCVFSNCINLKNVYYTGTEEQWNKILIDIGNESLTNATIHFNSIVNPDTTDFVRDYEFRKDWINQHITYANSNLYKAAVTQKFNGALGEALEEIKNNKMITAYNTLDSINSILDFDLDLSDEEEYELLLAQILFSRTGTTNINEMYDEYLSSNLMTICEVLIENIPQFATKEIKEQFEKLKKLSKGDVKYNEILNWILKEFDNYDNLDLKKECIEAFKDSKLLFATSFFVGEVETATDTLSEAIVYMAAGEAYCNTVTSFGDMLLSLRQHIAVPSNNALFDPYLVQRNQVDQQLINNMLDINGDPLNTPLSLYVLASAIENFYTQLENFKTDKGKSVAFNAVETFTEGTLSNLVKAELDVAVSLFECLPVVKEFSIIKALFDGTQFTIDVFTEIDERAYLGTMVMRLYGIAYIHYLTVDELAKTSNSWGDIFDLTLKETVFDENSQYQKAALFDESINTYKSILEVAVAYANEYYATYVNSKLVLPINKQQMSWKILELNQQLAYNIKGISCHGDVVDNGIINNPYYNNEKFKIYTFMCPVKVTVRNQNNELVAYLSNDMVNITEGYEPFFYVTETAAGSGDYAKIMVVPDEYQITLTGSDVGIMNVYVTSLGDEILGETYSFLNIPLTENTTGYISQSDNNLGVHLNVDEVEYLPNETSKETILPDETVETPEPTENNSTNEPNSISNIKLIIEKVGLVVVVAIIIFVIMMFFKKKKH